MRFVHNENSLIAEFVKCVRNAPMFLCGVFSSLIFLCHSIYSLTPFRLDVFLVLSYLVRK